MSLLTEATLIITPLGATLEMKAALEAPVNTDRGPQGFLPFDPDDAGGSKFYCSDVYAAMFNYVQRAFRASLQRRKATVPDPTGSGQAG